MHEFTMFHRKRNTAALKKALESGVLTVNKETGKVFGRKGKELKIKINAFGYPQVYLRFEGAMYFFYTHKVIWFASGQEIPPGFQLHHKNNDRADPRLENLECISRSENLAKRYQSDNVEPAF